MLRLRWATTPDRHDIERELLPGADVLAVKTARRFPTPGLPGSGAHGRHGALARLLDPAEDAGLLP